MRATLIAICALIGLILSFPLVFSADPQSSNYQLRSTTVTSGGGNASSSSYQQQIATGIMASIINSANFINSLGIFNTILLANSQPCTSASQCEGGFCCSNSCASSACTSGDSGSSGGTGTTSGGGGGGGGATNFSSQGGELPALSQDFELSSSSLHLKLALGEESESILAISNSGREPLGGRISVTGVEGMFSANPLSFDSLLPGESLNIVLSAIGRTLGSYLGQLEVTAGGITKTSDIIIEVESDQVLFDVAMDISPTYKALAQGGKLRSQITLFNVGVPRQVDVFITYLIKDNRGRVMSEESETFAVLGEKSYVHEFQIPPLEPGKYLAAVEVRYENSFAVSSDTFSISGSMPHPIAQAAFRNTTFFIALAILALILTIPITSLIKKRQKLRKKKR